MRLGGPEVSDGLRKCRYRRVGDVEHQLMEVHGSHRTAFRYTGAAREGLAKRHASDPLPRSRRRQFAQKLGKEIAPQPS